MVSIYLIRHGQASFGADNYDCLSELGLQQAEKLGQQFAKQIGGFDIAIRGDMLRHQQTAEQICQDLPIHIDANWNEYDHQNILAQLSPEYATPKALSAYLSKQANPNKTLKAIVKQAFSRWIANSPSDRYNESWPDFQSRILQGLHSLLCEYPQGENIAVITSGGPISLVCQHLLQVPIEQLFNLNWNLVNCGVTKLIRNRSGLFLSSMNEHSLFDGKNKHMLTYK